MHHIPGSSAISQSWKIPNVNIWKSSNQDLVYPFSCRFLISMQDDMSIRYVPDNLSPCQNRLRYTVDLLLSWLLCAYVVTTSLSASDVISLSSPLRLAHSPLICMLYMEPGISAPLSPYRFSLHRAGFLYPHNSPRSQCTLGILPGYIPGRNGYTPAVCCRNSSGSAAGK